MNEIQWQVKKSEWKNTEIWKVKGKAMDTKHWQHQSLVQCFPKFFEPWHTYFGTAHHTAHLFYYNTYIYNTYLQTSYQDLRKKLETKTLATRSRDQDQRCYITCRIYNYNYNYKTLATRSRDQDQDLGNKVSRPKSYYRA